MDVVRTMTGVFQLSILKVCFQHIKKMSGLGLARLKLENVGCQLSHHHVGSQCHKLVGSYCYQLVGCYEHFHKMAIFAPPLNSCPRCHEFHNFDSGRQDQHNHASNIYIHMGIEKILKIDYSFLEPDLPIKGP